MRNLSDLIKEENENKTFKYVAQVTIEGTVNATSESDAGELVDKEIDTIEGVVDYKMTSLDEIETVVTESITSETDEVLMTKKYLEIIELYENEKNELTPYYFAMLTAKLQKYFSEK